MPKSTRPIQKKKVTPVKIGNKIKSHHYDPSNEIHVAAMSRVASTHPSDKQKKTLLKKLASSRFMFDDLIRLATVMDSCNRKIVAVNDARSNAILDKQGRVTGWLE